MKTQKIFSSILDVLLLLVFMLFFASAGFQDKNTSGWYQQFFPNMNGSSITSITFLDSLTGFAVTNHNSSGLCYILKTTNGGDNWTVNYTYISGTSINFTKIMFANSDVGYASTTFYDFFKTTNSGTNWQQISTPDGAEDLSVINKDTVFVVTSDGLAGGVFRSTNGGFNWTALGQVGGSGQPSRIYMYDKNLGFTMSSSYMRRTTNGGFNWTIVTGESFADIKFADSLNGWKANLGIQKTTNGGLNWFSQQVPSTSINYYRSISILNKDTVWASGPLKNINNKIIGIILKTTNGGTNWGYQYLDTITGYDGFNYIIFLDKKHGWAFPYYTGGAVYDKEVHTITGGNDSTFITGINSNILLSSKEYKLYQNYPNPFNAISKIKYKILKSSEIKISVYDIMGKELTILLNERKNPGEYSVTFDGNNLSSGIYFYTMYINDVIIETKKMTLLK